MSLESLNSSKLGIHVHCAGVFTSMGIKKLLLGWYSVLSSFIIVAKIFNFYEAILFHSNHSFHIEKI